MEVVKQEQVRWAEYAAEIEAKNIPVYVSPKDSDRTDHEDVRTTLRDLFRDYLASRMLSSIRTRANFITTPCEHCDTLLWDGNGGVLASNPPRFWASCVGCGYMVALPLTQRIRQTP